MHNQYSTENTVYNYTTALLCNFNIFHKLYSEYIWLYHYSTVIRSVPFDTVDTVHGTPLSAVSCLTTHKLLFEHKFMTTVDYSNSIYLTSATLSLDRTWTHTLGSCNNMYILKWDYVNNNMHIIIYLIDTKI